jgi:hypothetical protein
MSEPKPYSLNEAKKKIRQLKGCIEDRCEIDTQIRQLKFDHELVSEDYYPFFQNSHQAILFDMFFDSPDKVFDYFWELRNHTGYMVITNEMWRKDLKRNVKRLIDLGIVKRNSPGLFQLAPAFKALRKKCRIEDPKKDG